MIVKTVGHKYVFHFVDICDEGFKNDDVCLEVRGKIIRTVLCCIVY